MARHPSQRLPPWERMAFIKDRGMTCSYCGIGGDYWKAEDGKPWEIDHVVPIMFGGDARDWSNLALSCGLCNAIKSTSSLDLLPERLAEMSGEHPAAMLAHRAAWPA